MAACSLTLGPVVGKVTANSVRILLEAEFYEAPAKFVCKFFPYENDLNTNDDTFTTVSTFSTATAGLTETELSPRQTDSSPTSTSNNKYYDEELADLTLYSVKRKLERINAAEIQQFPIIIPKPHTPFAFTIPNLHPCTTYYFFFEGVGDNSDRVARVRTLPVHLATPLAVAAVSKNSLQHSSKPLWKDLLRRGVDICLHLGSQIDGTVAFRNSLTVIKSGECQNEVDQENLILEFYRETYRRQYNEKYCKQVLATCSNLMLPDDGDIAKGFGTDTRHYNIESTEFYIATCARRVYWEYQRQLWDEALIPTQFSSFLQKNFTRHEAHYHVFSNVGVMFLDQIIGKVFLQDTQLSYLSDGQWSDIEIALSEAGQFAKCKTLIIATSAPLFMLEYKNTANDNIQNLKQLGMLTHSWAHTTVHYRELMLLIEMLSKWKRKDVNREIITVAGGFNFSFASVLFNSSSSDNIMHQICTSPMIDVPLSSKEESLIKALLNNTQQTLLEHYKMQHRLMSVERNFLVVEVSDLNPLPRCTIMKESLIGRTTPIQVSLEFELKPKEEKSPVTSPVATKSPYSMQFQSSFARNMSTLTYMSNTSSSSSDLSPSPSYALLKTTPATVTPPNRLSLGRVLSRELQYVVASPSSIVKSTPLISETSTTETPREGNSTARTLFETNSEEEEDTTVRRQRRSYKKELQARQCFMITGLIIFVVATLLSILAPLMAAFFPSQVEMTLKSVYSLTRMVELAALVIPLSLYLVNILLLTIPCIRIMVEAVNVRARAPSSFHTSKKKRKQEQCIRVSIPAFCISSVVLLLFIIGVLTAYFVIYGVKVYSPA